jgi:hypothetical protein
MTPCAGSASQGQLPIETLAIGEGLVILPLQANEWVIFDHF